jgi:hypothetical protein
MKIIKTDIHIHTCLSPCAEISISPKRIIEKAHRVGLNLLFITDHNTVENAEAAMKKAAEYKDLKVYPGIEITSVEEVHTLALFPCLNDALEVQKILYMNLPDSINEKEYERQVIANHFDEIEGYLKKSLFSSVNLNLNSIVELIHINKGLAIAAHVDRPSFSVIGQLGFIPNDIKYDALEVSPNLGLEGVKSRYNVLGDKYRFVSGSDSHTLQNFGTYFMELEMEDNSFESFKKYLVN